MKVSALLREIPGPIREQYARAGTFLTPHNDEAIVLLEGFPWQR
jgi:hypothetical protein